MRTAGQTVEVRNGAFGNPMGPRITVKLRLEAMEGNELVIRRNKAKDPIQAPVFLLQIMRIA
jgi:hypothetical protein